MLWVILADIFVGLVVYLIGSGIPKHKEKMRQIGLRISKSTSL